MIDINICALRSGVEVGDGWHELVVAFYDHFDILFFEASGWRGARGEILYDRNALFIF
jgi:hypothetical protein